MYSWEAWRYALTILLISAISLTQLFFKIALRDEGFIGIIPISPLVAWVYTSWLVTLYLFSGRLSKALEVSVLRPSTFACRPHIVRLPPPVSRLWGNRRAYILGLFQPFSSSHDRCSILVSWIPQSRGQSRKCPELGSFSQRTLGIWKTQFVMQLPLCHAAVGTVANLAWRIPLCWLNSVTPLCKCPWV